MACLGHQTIDHYLQREGRHGRIEGWMEQCSHRGDCRWPNTPLFCFWPKQSWPQKMFSCSIDRNEPSPVGQGAFYSLPTISANRLRLEIPFSVRKPLYHILQFIRCGNEHGRMHDCVGERWGGGDTRRTACLVANH